MAERVWGFRINISCDSLEVARNVTLRGFSAVLVGGSSFTGSKTVRGMKLTACPQKVGKVRDCIECKGLCARPRDAVVVFPAHGTGRKKVDQLLFPEVKR